jgi:hypothetical protein
MRKLPFGILLLLVLLGVIAVQSQGIFDTGQTVAAAVVNAPTDVGPSIALVAGQTAFDANQESAANSSDLSQTALTAAITPVAVVASSDTGQNEMGVFATANITKAFSAGTTTRHLRSS